ncbi:MAG: hypothetical protein NTU93_10015 [Arthrobacter sp.]|nr:hypothetical protein [Arthrobacter sp.]
MSRPVRVQLGSGAIWTGILVTHVSFCVLFSIGTLFLPPSAVGFSFLLVAALLVGAIPAVVIGWALGMPLGALLQPVRNQWLHVAAFGGLGAAIGLPFGGFADPPMLLTAAGMAVSAAMGRLSVWRLTRVNDDGGPPAPGTEAP